MASPLTPDLAGPRRLALAAAVVTLLVCALLLLSDGPALSVRLGDSDDALRLQRVRDLLAGEGWFDRTVERIQPPEGGEIHWSRLLDGGLAAMVRAFDSVMSRASAEQWTRAIWPMLWIGPAVAGALLTARALGGGPAAFLCAVLLGSSTLAFVQFTPGRIDHHGIQVALAVTGLAGAAVGGVRGGLLTAASAGVGLAVGVEALAFHALIGAGLALRWAFQPQEAARAAGAYGLLLPVLLIGLHGVQTAPSAWAEPACDMLGANLIAAASVGALGLFAAARFLSRASLPVRLAALAVVGGAAATIYAAAEPACLGGPLGAADPRLGPAWLDHVDEVQSVRQTFARSPAETLAFLSPVVVGLLMLAWSMLDARLRRHPAWLLTGAFLLLGFAAQAAASRMAPYAIWAAMPVIAAGVARVGEQAWRSRLLPSLATVLLMSPFVVALAVGAVAERVWPSNEAPSRSAACYANAGYRSLAGLPPGRVLAPVYLGSHVVALTPHQTISAPYHRMARGVLTSEGALAASPEQAEPLVRGLGVHYVVTCPGLADSDPNGPDLRAALDAGRPPPWLEPVARPGGALNVYRVRPAS